MNHTKLLLATFAGVALSVGSGHAAIVAPYTADSDTLHLWHLDKDSSPTPSNTPDSVSAGGVAVSNQSGSTWGSPAFTGFGQAGNTGAASNSIIRSNAGTLRNVPVGAGGAFTFEAMINISTTAGSQQIFAMDSNNTNTQRPFWFRVINGNLDFFNIGNGLVHTQVAIPTSGPDAFVANEWFHAAVTYDGNEGTAGNLKLYWTRVDDSRTEANLIGSGTQGDLQGTAVFGIGNAYRTVGAGVTANLEGSIDEVRISGIARGADDMLFAVPAPSTTFPLIITPNATNPGNYDFSWDSKDGKLYDLVSDTDLATAPDTWAVWASNADIVGAAPTNSLMDVPGGGDPARFFAVVEKDPPPLLSEDFEADDGGFTTVNKGTGTDWAWGAPISPSQGGGEVTSGNNSAKCWGTDIGDPGGYVAGTDTVLRSPVIDLTNVATATLSFAEALDIENPHTLVVNVIEAATDTVLQTAVHTSTPDTDIVRAVWKAVNGIAITGGQPVRLEWRFIGNGSGFFLGAYIDDVVVSP